MLRLQATPPHLGTMRALPVGLWRAARPNSPSSIGTPNLAVTTIPPEKVARHQPNKTRRRTACFQFDCDFSKHVAKHRKEDCAMSTSDSVRPAPSRRAGIVDPLPARAPGSPARCGVAPPASDDYQAPTRRRHASGCPTAPSGSGPRPGCPARQTGRGRSGGQRRGRRAHCAYRLGPECNLAVGSRTGSGFH